MKKDNFLERPYVISHLLSSLDGKISGKFFSSPQTKKLRSEYAKLRENYKADAILNGSITCSEIYADGFLEEVPKSNVKIPREDFLAETDLDSYVVCVDTEGTLKWSKNFVDRPNQPKAHVIVVLTENVNDGYLSYLQDLGISYIFCGTDELDMEQLMEKLKKNFHINTLLTTGGGKMNWSLLSSGFLDELSLVVSPVVDGLNNTSGIFDSSEYVSGGIPQEFILEEVTQLPENGLRLRYLKR